jgi:asparagine synthetase B (glutamine-hydrolysing)
MVEESLYVMSSMEIVFGSPLGHSGTLPPPTGVVTTPRAALEEVVRAGLLRPPCGIAFSGGRDSSLVLAVATHVARREGLPEPVPVTKVFPGVPRAEEDEWQKTVVDHLRLQDWQRIVIGDELDLLGQMARERLLEHGVVWPPTVHGDVPMLELLGGGTLLDGEGGDEVLGVTSHRIAPLSRLIRAPRPLRWRRVRSALGAVAPGGVRSRHVRRQWTEHTLTWLRPAARDAVAAALGEVEAAQPLSFSASVRMVPRRRTQLLARRNRRILATPYDVDVSSPLLDPIVVHALAEHGGVLGPGDRTMALRALASDLLPDSIMSRTTKAEFGGAYMGQPTRDFAEHWTGNGVDPALIDVDELRRLWRSDQRIAPTAALLQSAWLGSSAHERSPTP